MTNGNTPRHAFRPAWLVAAAAAAFSTSLVLAASGDQAQPPKAPSAAFKHSTGPVAPPPVKDMTAEEEDAWATASETTITQICSTCHPTADIVKTRHTWREWNDVVKNMAAIGAPATDEQQTTIKLYLARYYGVVSINTASAEEIQAVLGLPSKQAAAVVAYRTANGKFTDLASLEKVDGIDKAKLEEQPEAIRYN